MVFIFAWCVVFLLASEADSRCPDGRDISKYAGEITVTDSGRSCQKWAAQIPHAHDYNNSDYFKVDGSIEEAVNYCRNPDSDPLPWCYTTDPFTRWQYCTGQICNTDNVVCGGVQTSDSGWITHTSTLVAEFTPQDCLWTLMASPNYLIEIKAIQKDFFDKESCNNYVQIYETGFHYGRFCGKDTTIPSVTSKSGVLYVRFYSIYAGSSFSANYSQVKVPSDTLVMDPTCGGMLPPKEGWIYSPDRDGDGQYQPVEDCYWAILVPSKHYIVLETHFMDIEDIPKCDNDFLEVYDASNSYGKFCGDDYPEDYPYIISSSSVVYLRFFSDFEETGGGFNISYYSYPIDEKPPTTSEEGSNLVFDTTSSPMNRSTVVFSAGVDTKSRHGLVLAPAVGTMIVVTMAYNN